MSSNSMDAFAHGAAGAAGGVIAMALLYPLDNIRTRLQVQISRKHSTATTVPASTPVTVNPSSTYASHVKQTCSSPSSHKDTTVAPVAHSTSTTAATPSPSTVAAGVPSEQYHFHGTIDCIRQICEREGWQKLYTGLSSALIGVGASSAVYFFWYHHFKTMILTSSGKKSLLPLDNILVACVAGVVNIFITLPVWVINTRMTLSNKYETYESVMDCVQKIYRNEGFGGFYKGLIPSLLLVSNPAIQFVCYEQFIRILSRRSASSNQKFQLTSIEYFLLGAIAKAIATFITYPIQVVKSRTQAHKHSGDTIHTIRTMWNKEGISSFYHGMNAKMSQTVLNSAFMFTVYEKLVRFMLAVIRWFMKHRNPVV